MGDRARHGCTGAISGGSVPGNAGPNDPGSTITPNTWTPIVPCEPRAPTRVSRLSDRHLSNSVRDLLGLAAAPSIQTSASSTEQFLPNKPAPVNGAVALSMRDLAERLAGPATEEGQIAVRCEGDARSCASRFIDQFASRAFRRPVRGEERAGLLAVYDAGFEGYGGHRGGIRLVIEAVLQSPSFLYLTESGEGSADRRSLTSFELAHKLSFFLYDGLPDDALWSASAEGRLETTAEVEAHVDRLLEREDVKANVARMVERLFDLELLRATTKADTVAGFGPELVDAMLAETRRFIDATLWEREGTLRALLTSRETFVNDPLAAIYGVSAPGSDALLRPSCLRPNEPGSSPIRVFSLRMHFPKRARSFTAASSSCASCSAFIPRRPCPLFSSRASRSTHRIPPSARVPSDEPSFRSAGGVTASWIRSVSCSSITIRSVGSGGRSRPREEPIRSTRRSNSPCTTSRERSRMAWPWPRRSPRAEPCTSA